MTITAYDFEGGTNGANLATGGGILAVSSTPPTYATSAAFTSSDLGISGGAQGWAEWDCPAVDWSGSLYIKVTANPGTSSARVIAGRTAAGGNAGAIRFHSSGAISIVSATNTILSTASTTWTTTDTFRLDWQVNTTGADVAITLRIFKNANISGTTPDETLGPTTITGTDFDEVRIGNIDTNAFTVQYDNLQLSDVLEWIGPYSPALVPLDTPVVTVTNITNPTTPGGTDGTVTVTWPAVDDADHYAAAKAVGHDVTSGFTITSSAATSPYTFTGLAAGNYTVAIRAVP